MDKDYLVIDGTVFITKENGMETLLIDIQKESFILRSPQLVVNFITKEVFLWDGNKMIPFGGEQG